MNKFGGFVGFDLNKPYINEVLGENVFSSLRTVEFDKEQSELFIMLNLSGEERLKLVFEDQDFLNEFLVRIFNKSLTHYKLEDKIDKYLIIYGLFCFGIDTPGKLNLFIILLLEWSKKNNKKATINDLGIGIFPFGFYDDDACRKIINECFKTKLSVFSELY